MLNWPELENLREKEKLLSVCALLSPLARRRALCGCVVGGSLGGLNTVLGFHALLVLHSAPHGQSPPPTHVCSDAPAEARGKTGSLPPDRNAWSHKGSSPILLPASSCCRLCRASSCPSAAYQSIPVSAGSSPQGSAQVRARQRGAYFTVLHSVARYVRL